MHFQKTVSRISICLCLMVSSESFGQTVVEAELISEPPETVLANEAEPVNVTPDEVLDAEQLAIVSSDDVACCPQPSCRPCCSCYRSCSPFYGYVESVFYDRNDSTQDQVLIVDENRLPAVVPLLTTGGLDSDIAPGVRALLGWHYDCNRSIEFGYLGIFDWDGGATLRGNNNLGVVGDIGLVVNNFTGADFVDVNYSSNLHSFEANCVKCDPYCCGRVEWLMGLRYLSMNEDFHLLSTDNQQGSTFYDVDADNDLYGAQLGMRVRRWRMKHFEWEGTVKAGLYGNDASQTQFISPDFPPAGPVRPTVGASESNAAFVGELNWSLIYRMTNRVALRGGYNVLWVEGLALAPDQLDFTNTPTSGTGISTNGGLFAHGISIGAELTW